jgi:uncharacterized membrane protein
MMATIGAATICVASVCAVLAATLLSGRVGAAEVPSDADMLAITHKHCVQCHAAEPTHEAFAKPPAGIMLETIEQIRRYAPRILDQVTVTRAMPLGNETGMTDEERDSVAAWIEGRK